MIRISQNGFLGEEKSILKICLTDVRHFELLLLRLFLK